MWEDVRRCEKMWEDVRRCEKMRRCEDEKMWEDVKMRRCEDEKMWEDVRRCEKMWRWEDEEKMRRRWEDEEKMRRWGEDVRRRRCKDEKMWRWEDVKMRRWGEDVGMRRCEDEKMWRWEGVLQTPTIGRTLRSDALGKNYQTEVCSFDKGEKRISIWAGFFLTNSQGWTVLARCLQSSEFTSRPRLDLQLVCCNWFISLSEITASCFIDFHFPQSTYLTLFDIAKSIRKKSCVQTLQCLSRTLYQPWCRMWKTLQLW